MTTALKDWWGLARGRPLLLLVAIAGAGLALDVVIGVATDPGYRSSFTTFFWNGILVGLILGLAGMGLSMTYSILNFANFSHGDLVTAGAFSGWSVTYALAGFGAANFGSLVLINPDGNAPASAIGVNVEGTFLAVLAGLLAAVALTILVALLVDRLVYKPMRDQSGIALLIASIGVALALRYLIDFVYGGRNRGVTANEPTWDLLPFLSDYGAVNAHHASLMIVAVALMLGTHLLLQYSKLGTAMRAMADNEDLALVTGIPTERVVTWTWVIGGGLTGAAGYLIVLERGVLDFNLGWGLLLLVFAAVILGGIGSVYGAIGGGLVIGLASEVSIMWIPADFATPVAFLMMILVLVLKPSGLFGGVTTA